MQDGPERARPGGRGRGGPPDRVARRAAPPRRGHRGERRRHHPREGGRNMSRLTSEHRGVLARLADEGWGGRPPRRGGRARRVAAGLADRGLVVVGVGAAGLVLPRPRREAVHQDPQHVTTPTAGAHARAVDRPEHPGPRRGGGRAAGRARRRRPPEARPPLRRGQARRSLSAYDLAREGTPLAEAELVVEEVPLIGATARPVRRGRTPGVGRRSCAAPSAAPRRPRSSRGRELEVVALEIES